MLRLSHPVLIRLAAVFIALQALWSSAATTAYAAGFDAAKYMCSQVLRDAQAQAAIAELVALAGLEDPQPAPEHDGSECVACMLGHAVALDCGGPVLAIASNVSAEPQRVRVDRASPRQPAGPPVGLRAPPFTN